MTQDDVFNILHYFTPWQLALIGAALIIITFLIALTKLSGLALIAPILLFINPMYNVSLVVFACVLLAVYFGGWYLGSKRREQKAKEKREAQYQQMIAQREAESADNSKKTENSLDNNT